VKCSELQVPFDECSLCRLFLHSAGGNFDAYERPTLNAGPEVQALLSALLEIDMRKRATPKEFMEMAVDWSTRHRTTA
jgi:hypothetical protein